MVNRTKTLIGCIAGVVVITASFGAAAIAATDGNDEVPAGPNVASLQSVSALDDSSAPSMSVAEYARLQWALPTTSEPDDSGLVEADLPSRAEGKVLFATLDGQRMSATRLDGGQVCYTFTSASAAMAACSHELLDAGISPSGAWSEEGHTLFGMTGDTVTGVQVRTNQGDVQDATLGRSSYIWASNSPSREIYGVAVVVTHDDASVDVVNLPDPGFATNSPFG